MVQPLYNSGRLRLGATIHVVYLRHLQMLSCDYITWATVDVVFKSIDKLPSNKPKVEDAILIFPALSTACANQGADIAECCACHLRKYYNTWCADMAYACWWSPPVAEEDVTDILYRHS
jgi:hypothetical protein